MDARQSEKLVSDFLASWQERDIERIMGFFADDAVYHNVPVDPIRGAAALRAIFEGFLAAFRDARLEVLNITAKPDLVMTERVDHFVTNDDAVIALPVAGVFELADGHITRFSDYFDLASFERASGLKL